MNERNKKFMSTRAYVGIRNSNGTITAIYNHCDGGLQDLGRILCEYFQTEESVRELMEFGKVSSIQDMETVNDLKSIRNYYEPADWKKLNTVSGCMVHLMSGPKENPIELMNIEDAIECMIGHAYLFIPEEMKWYYTKGNGLKPLN